MGSIVADAQHLAQLLTAAGCRATADPERAAHKLPCVLVPPPSMDYTEHATTWELALLSAQPAGTFAALVELDQLLGDLHAAGVVHPERAVPRSYSLRADVAPLPAYIVTITT